MRLASNALRGIQKKISALSVISVVALPKALVRAMYATFTAAMRGGSISCATAAEAMAMTAAQISSLVWVPQRTLYQGEHGGHRELLFKMQ
jgi:hypothetical protein